MRYKLSLSFICLWGAITGWATTFNQLVLSETFEADALGVLTTAGGWTNVDPSSLKSSRKIEVRNDSGNVMGSGTGNQLLFFQNTASDPVKYDTLIASDGISTGKLLRVSVDFYEPSTLAGGLIVSVGGGTGADHPVNEFSLTDGTLGPSGIYAVDAMHHLDAIFNETGASIDYEDPGGGTSTLATGLMDIWIDQVRVAAGATQGRDANPSIRLSSVLIRNADSQQEIYLDNFQVYTVEVDTQPPDPPVELLISNIVLAAGNVQLDWNPPSDHFIVIAADQPAALGKEGTCVVSSTTSTHTATFAYSSSAGFFRIMTGVAAVDSITSPVLVNEINTLSPLNAPAGHVYDAELGAIKGITLTNRSFAVTELAHLVELEKLSLAGIQLSTLPDFSGFDRLTWLNLSDNQLSDIFGLNGLTNLEALNLESNLISSLVGIESLIHLRWLDLENNQVADLSAVMTNAAAGGLGEGDELWLRGNPLSSAATNQIQILENTYNVKVYY